MQLNRLLPEPGPVTAETLFDDIDFAAMAPPGRPYVVINMVASVDGRATYEGRTEGLSSDADRAVFHALRTSVEAVMVGTATVREESYGRMVRRPELQACRRARGLHPEPYALIVSRSGDFPEEAPLFSDPEARVIRSISATPGEALRRAREEQGIRSVLCEGGPTLNAAMLAEGVFDELFLTIAPTLVGDDDPLTIFGGGGPAPLELKWVLEESGSLFLRYARAG